MTAAVQDAETPVSQLVFEWTADGGTFTGTGAVGALARADRHHDPGPAEGHTSRSPSRWTARSQSVSLDGHGPGARLDQGNQRHVRPVPAGLFGPEELARSTWSATSTPGVPGRAEELADVHEQPDSTTRSPATRSARRPPRPSTSAGTCPYAQQDGRRRLRAGAGAVESHRQARRTSARPRPAPARTDRGLPEFALVALRQRLRRHDHAALQHASSDSARRTGRGAGVRAASGRRHRQPASSGDGTSCAEGDPVLDEGVPLVAVRALPEQFRAAVVAPLADVGIEVEHRLARQFDVAADARGIEAGRDQRLPDVLVNRQGVRAVRERFEAAVPARRPCALPT
ncbi:MAG: hypothetical protein MZU95_03180 [Desulfomicrobium escambiense]|nr:hypothetical protein [Desulfomicrobium escambiense]